MIPNRPATLFLLAVCVLSATPALAGPFCAVNADEGRRCYYYTMQDCLKAAGARGTCALNPYDPVHQSSTNAPLCVTTASESHCWYYSVDACRRAAQNLGGQCTVPPAAAR